MEEQNSCMNLSLTQRMSEPRLRLNLLNIKQAIENGSTITPPKTPLNESEKNFLIEKLQATHTNRFYKNFLKIMSHEEKSEIIQYSNVLFQGSLNTFDLSRPKGEHLKYTRKSFDLQDNSTPAKKKCNAERSIKLMKAFSIWHTNKIKFTLSELKQSIAGIRSNHERGVSIIITESKINDIIENSTEVPEQDYYGVMAYEWLRVQSQYKLIKDKNSKKYLIKLVAHFFDYGLTTRLFILDKFSHKFSAPETLLNTYGPELYLELLHMIDDQEYEIKETYNLPEINNDKYFLQEENAKNMIRQKKKELNQEYNDKRMLEFLSKLESKIKGIHDFGKSYIEIMRNNSPNNLKKICPVKYKSYLSIINDFQRTVQAGDKAASENKKIIVKTEAPTYNKKTLIRSRLQNPPNSP